MEKEEIVALLGETVREMAEQNETFVTRVLAEFSNVTDAFIDAKSASSTDASTIASARLVAAAIILAGSNKGLTYAVDKIKELETILNS